jgi:hypothetical protein
MDRTLLDGLRSQRETIKAQVGGGRFGVYAYLRERSSANGKAGSPYYIGKMGRSNRPWKSHNAPPPANPALVRILRGSITEEQANEWEKSYIKRYGRIDQGTGCLRNLTDGGDGTSGRLKSADEVAQIRETKLKNSAEKYGISYEQWASLSIKERSTVKTRHKRGNGKGTLLHGINGSGLNPRMVATADKYGIAHEVWAALSPPQRALVCHRYADGWRGPALLENFDRNSRVVAASERFGIPYERYVSFSARDRKVIFLRYRNGKRGPLLLTGLVPA